MTELYEDRTSDRAATPRTAVAAWAVVAVVAILAGVGVATIGPKSPSSTAPTDSRDGSLVKSISPRMVDLTFNPRTTRGLKLARVAFRFTIEHRARDRDRVRVRFDEGWDVMRSRVFRALSRHTPDELRTDGGIEIVDRDLRATIDGALFADGLARTREVLWERILVQ